MLFELNPAPFELVPVPLVLIPTVLLPINPWFAAINPWFAAIKPLDAAEAEAGRRGIGDRSAAAFFARKIAPLLSASIVTAAFGLQKNGIFPRFFPSPSTSTCIEGPPREKGREKGLRANASKAR